MVGSSFNYLEDFFSPKLVGNRNTHLILKKVRKKSSREEVWKFVHIESDSKAGHSKDNDKKFTSTETAKSSGSGETENIQKKNKKQRYQQNKITGTKLTKITVLSKKVGLN